MTTSVLCLLILKYLLFIKQFLNSFSGRSTSVQQNFIGFLCNNNITNTLAMLRVKVLGTLSVSISFRISHRDVAIGRTYSKPCTILNLLDLMLIV